MKYFAHGPNGKSICVGDNHYKSLEIGFGIPESDIFCVAQVFGDGTSITTDEWREFIESSDVEIRDENGSPVETQYILSKLGGDRHGLQA